ncbi:hypothetical protein ABT127_04390 [Streptomyces sp. NPDC001904]|uniref:hypothetical protein n=1 Tax=Streptomyces sp. NPDC001904 TaxID=3154531 RepID=UPI00332ECED2
MSTPEPQPTPAPVPEPERAHVRRQGWLSASGAFLAGLAALLGLITAVGSTYVAVATYEDQREAAAITRKDQRKAEEKKDAEKIDRYVRRVTLLTDEGRWTIANRNLDIVQDVTIEYVVVLEKMNPPEIRHYSKALGVMPPCTVWSQTVQPPKGGQLDYIAARFIADGKFWRTALGGVYRAGEQQFVSGPLLPLESVYPGDRSLPAARKASFCQ